MSCPSHDALVDYVDEVLRPSEALAVERHVVACQLCRHEIAAERELIARLRGGAATPARESTLMAGLLSMAPEQPAPSGRPAHLATLSTDAPPQYVSVRRSLGFAVLAAVAGCAGAVAVVGHTDDTSPARMQQPVVVRSQPASTAPQHAPVVDARFPAVGR